MFYSSNVFDNFCNPIVTKTFFYLEALSNIAISSWFSEFLIKIILEIPSVYLIQRRYITESKSYFSF